MAIQSPFFLNCYCNCSLIVLQNGNGTASLLHSREGVTQGRTLAMAAYGIGIIPLIKLPKVAYPDVTHPWHADNVGALGMY